MVEATNRARCFETSSPFDCSIIPIQDAIIGGAVLAGGLVGAALGKAQSNREQRALINGKPLPLSDDFSAQQRKFLSGLVSSSKALGIHPTHLEERFVLETERLFIARRIDSLKSALESLEAQKVEGRKLPERLEDPEKPMKKISEALEKTKRELKANQTKIEEWMAKPEIKALSRADKGELSSPSKASRASVMKGAIAATSGFSAFSAIAQEAADRTKVIKCLDLSPSEDSSEVLRYLDSPGGLVSGCNYSVKSSMILEIQKMDLPAQKSLFEKNPSLCRIMRTQNQKLADDQKAILAMPVRSSMCEQNPMKLTVGIGGKDYKAEMGAMDGSNRGIQIRSSLTSGPLHEQSKPNNYRLSMDPQSGELFGLSTTYPNGHMLTSRSDGSGRKIEPFRLFQDLALNGKCPPFDERLERRSFHGNSVAQVGCLIGGNTKVFALKFAQLMLTCRVENVGQSPGAIGRSASVAK